MKLIFSLKFVALLALTWLAVPGHAQELSAATSVTLKEGKLVALVGREEAPVQADLNLPHAIVVKPDATYSVKQGKPRKLLEGQRLDRKGMLHDPDGWIVPVYDHVSKLKGRIFVMRDGQYRELSQAMSFPDGTLLQPDGTVRLQGRRKINLIDGQLISLDGAVIPTVDTITLTQGRVTVQKNGTLIPLDPRSSLMMDDGSKVFGDGRVQKPDGSTVRLKDGQILQVEGVQQRLR